MLPSLTKLGPAQLVSTYLDKDLEWIEWIDRDDLVVGGCRTGSAQETKCYDDWNAIFFDNVIENTKADTIVMLSVGAGVLELKSIEVALTVRNNAVDKPIANIWLIDPYIDSKKGKQVAVQYAGRLEDTDVTYFTGMDAYQDATNAFTTSPVPLVATVGSLNTSFGILSNTTQHQNLYDSMIKFVELIATDERRGGIPLHVVQAYHNEAEGYVVKNELATVFTERQRKRVSTFNRLATRG